MVLEKTLETLPLDCKETKPINPKRNKLWRFIGKTDAEAEAPILWPPDTKSWLTGKDPGAGRDWKKKEKGTAEDEMVRQHCWLNGHDSEQIPGDTEGQGNLVCCSPSGHKKSDTTQRPNNNIQNQAPDFRSKSKGTTYLLPEWEQRRGEEWSDFESRLNELEAKADREKGRWWGEGIGPDQTNAEIQIWSLDFSILSVFVVKTSWLGFLLFVMEEI